MGEKGKKINLQNDNVIGNQDADEVSSIATAPTSPKMASRTEASQTTTTSPVPLTPQSQKKNEAESLEKSTTAIKLPETQMASVVDNSKESGVDHFTTTKVQQQ